MGTLRFEPKDSLEFYPVGFQLEPATEQPAHLPPMVLTFQEYRLEIPNGFDPDTLQNVLLALGGSVMLMQPGKRRVFIALGITDMRKAINGLSLLVETARPDTVFSGDLFVFSNRQRTLVKLIYWDRNGFAMWQKRLEEERFRWPKTKGEVLEIGPKELSWLLEGLDIRQAHRRLQYSAIN